MFLKMVSIVIHQIINRRGITSGRPDSGVDGIDKRHAASREGRKEGLPNKWSCTTVDNDDADAAAADDDDEQLRE